MTSQEILTNLITAIKRVFNDTHDLKDYGFLPIIERAERISSFYLEEHIYEIIEDLYDVVPHKSEEWLPDDLAKAIQDAEKYLNL